MQELIPQNDIFVFAEDTTVVTKHTDQRCPEIDTFAKINYLFHFLEENKLRLNADKTNSMLHLKPAKKMIFWW